MLDERGNYITSPVSLKDVLAFREDDLAKPKTLDDIKLAVWILEHEHQVTDVREALRHIRTLVNASNLTESNAKLHGEYQQFISFMQLLCMNDLELNELMDVLRTHMVYALGREANVRDYLIKYLMLYGDPDGKLRRGIIQAIRENTERIGDAPITIRGHDKPDDPTVENWLKQYSVTVTKDPFRIESIDVVEFMKNDENVRLLGAKDQETLQTIIEMYNYFRSPDEIREIVHIFERDLLRERMSAGQAPQPVMTADAVRQPAKRTIEDIKAGMGKRKLDVDVPPPSPQPPVPPAVPSAPTVPPMRNKPREGIMSYVEQTVFDTAVTEAESKLLKQVGKGTLDVRETLETSIAAKDAPRAAAILSILAQTRDVLPLIAKDGVFRRKLVQKFGEDVGVHFDAQPGAPVYLRIYLEYVFQDRLGMPEPDAARTGVRIANIMGKKYLKVAYMDMRTGVFSWADVAVDGGALRLNVS